MYNPHDPYHDPDFNREREEENPGYQTGTTGDDGVFRPTGVDPQHTGSDPADPTGMTPQPETGGPTPSPETTPLWSDDERQRRIDGRSAGDGDAGDPSPDPSTGPPFSDDYWTGFMERFQHGFQGDIPQVSAGTPRAENREVDAFQQYLMDQAREHMDNPSRYDADLVRQGMDVVNAQIQEMRRTGTSAIDSRMAQRGLAGSSLEAEQHQLHESALDRHANERAFALSQDQARTWAQDRSSAFQMGLGAGQQAMTRDQQLMQTDIQNRALDLQAQGMNQDAAFRQATLDWQMAESAARMGLDREGQLMDWDLRDRGLGLQERQIDQGQDNWDQEFSFRQQQFAADEDYRWAQLDQSQWNNVMSTVLWMLEQDQWKGESFQDLLKMLAADYFG